MQCTRCMYGEGLSIVPSAVQAIYVVPRPGEFRFGLEELGSEGPVLLSQEVVQLQDGGLIIISVVTIVGALEKSREK